MVPCNSKESLRTQEGQIAAERTKQHEGEEDAGMRTAGLGSIYIPYEQCVKVPYQ